ncbi:MRG/MORF4L-binding protein isoform X2 [Cimex lectularius]|uniref:Uncharacterized protein n=1 Tax=Cimex lectularius TaxID=79782 RepID=A0A8I6S782_CIMLE|nr:MRG/MORF4L-binding protein isoform X2 [Cimex lectularius]
MTLEEEAVEWTAYSDLHLINSLAGLRAVGINHNFCMALVTHRFSMAMHVKLVTSKLRERLSNFYDFEAAEKLSGEVLFPNEVRPFTLPSEYKEKIEAKKAAFEMSNNKPKRNSNAPKVVPVVKNTKTPKRSDVKDEKKTPLSQSKRKTRIEKNETLSGKRRR